MMSTYSLEGYVGDERHLSAPLPEHVEGALAPVAVFRAEGRTDPEGATIMLKLDFIEIEPCLVRRPHMDRFRSNSVHLDDFKAVPVLQFPERRKLRINATMMKIGECPENRIDLPCQRCGDQMHRVAELGALGMVSRKNERNYGPFWRNLVQSWTETWQVEIRRTPGMRVGQHERT